MLTNLLDRLDAHERARLLAIGQPHALADGEEIARQATVGDCLFVVEEGELAIVRRVPGNEEERLEVAPAGTLVGELAVLDRRPRSASLRAMGPARVRAIEVRAFESLTLDAGSVGHRVLRAVALSLQDRLEVARAAVASRFESAATTTWPCDPRGIAPSWSAETPMPIRLPHGLAAFALLRPAELAHVASELECAALPAGAQFAFPLEPGDRCVTLLLRGAVSPCLVSGAGDAVVLPVVAPGSFVDPTAALDTPGAPMFWRARSAAVLARLPARHFRDETPTGARLLYALCRDLATAVRSTTALAMHLGMAWDGARARVGGTTLARLQD